ncbi:hypothetical protein ACFSSA_00045 [Luteolibacter algae]|uniref:Plasmid mobilization relaxosome protein MobC n=1 Tax=Luteolibacter algae TaxID=454151 RepID=A0ABW5D3M6_9BACT
MARPTKNADRRLSRHVVFHLTEEEYKSLHDKAALAGLSTNELARRRTTRGKRKLVVETTKRVDPAFLKRIDRIGQNLNQLVKNAHTFGRLSPQVDALATTIDEIIHEALHENPE